MRNAEVERFISKFCNLISKRNSIPSRSRRFIPSTLRNIIYQELPKRDNDRELEVRELANSNQLNVYYDLNDITVCKNSRGKLVVGVLAPFWSRGLRPFCRDDFIYDEVSWFLHFSRQYVARSKFIEVVGSIALSYNRDTHFRTSNLKLFQISDFGYDINTAKRKAFGRKALSPNNQSSRRQREFLYWIKMINGLDPFIHRMLFNYSKALQLLHAYFDEEAITALDKTINIAEQFVLYRLKQHSKNQRELLANICGLNASEKNLLIEIYKIRCHFGAHPSSSKWWDFPEIFDEEDFVSMFEVSKHLIQKLLLLEIANRVVEKHPSSWSDWFMKNIDVLYNSIWFSQYPYI